MRAEDQNPKRENPQKPAPDSEYRPPSWLWLVKLAVFIMTALLIIGFSVVVITIATRLGEKGTNPTSAEQISINIPLPPSCQVKSATSDGQGKILLLTDGPLSAGCQQLLLIDARSGKTLVTLQFTEKAR